MKRFTVALAIAACVGSLAVAQPASAYPSGTKIVTPAGTSSQAYDLVPIDVSDSGVLAAADDNFAGTSRSMFRSWSGAVSVLAPQFTGHLTRLRGSNIYVDNGTSFLFRTTTSPTIGTCAKGDRYLVDFTPTGAILWNFSNSGIVLTAATVSGASCSMSAFATLGSSNSDGVWRGASGPNGIVIQWSAGDTMTLTYFPFANPSAPVALTMVGGDAAGMSVGTSAVSWVDEQDHLIVRSPLSGGATTSTSYVNYAPATATTGSATVWWEYSSSYTTSRLRSWTGANGGTVTNRAYTLDRGLATDGIDLYIGHHAAPGAAGVQRTNTSFSSATLIWPSTTTPLRAGAVVVSPGRVTYTTNKGAFDYWSLYKRSLTGSASSLTLGSQSLVSSHASHYGITVSGRRTAFERQGTTSATTDSYLARDGHTTRLIAHNAMQPLVSGLRVLYYALGSGWKLRDLRPGGATTALSSAADYTLWGNYLVSLSSTGKIVRKSLATGTSATVRAATASGSTTVVEAGIAAFGDVVAWTQRSASSSSVWWRNMVTGTTRHVAASYPAALHASAKYLVWREYTDPTHSALKRVPIGSTTVSTITSAVTPSGDDFSVDDERVAFVGPDLLARVAPLPAFSTRPRYLGLRYAEGSFKPGSTNPTWDFETVFSKALTTCHLVIKRSGVVVRNLSCATSTGDVIVSWNGKNSSGTVQPAGTYTWTLTGGDADGAIAGANGKSTTFSGSFSRRA